MFGPISAKQVRAAGQNGIAGICQSRVTSYPKYYGWFVPYQEMPEDSECSQAVIILFVQDLLSYADHLPFIIDTGSDVTIIPRKLLEPRAFPKREAIAERGVIGVTGKVVTGLRFKAAIAISKLPSGPSSFSFPPLQPVIVDNWESDCGVLGLDALRKVVMVSDQNYVSFWPLPTDSKPRKRKKRKA